MIDEPILTARMTEVLVPYFIVKTAVFAAFPLFFPLVRKSWKHLVGIYGVLVPLSLISDFTLGLFGSASFLLLMQKVFGVLV